VLARAGPPPEPMQPGWALEPSFPSAVAVLGRHGGCSSPAWQMAARLCLLVWCCSHELGSGVEGPALSMADSGTLPTRVWGGRAAPSTAPASQVWGVKADGLHPAPQEPPPDRHHQRLSQGLLRVCGWSGSPLPAPALPTWRRDLRVPR